MLKVKKNNFTAEILKIIDYIAISRLFYGIIFKHYEFFENLFL
jgi:hypothetical protein